MIPCGPDYFVHELIKSGKEVNIDWKWSEMVSFLPKHTVGWHDSQFYESGRWMSTHPEIMDSTDYQPYPGEMIFRNINKGMQDYIGDMFRNPAKEISNSDQGYWLKIHGNAELDIKNILPSAEVISVENYESIQERFMRRKTGFKDYEKDPRYLKFRREYKPTGYVIDLEKLMDLDHSYYIKTMRDLHEHLGLDQPPGMSERLVAYKMAYLKSSGDPV